RLVFRLRDSLRNKTPTGSAYNAWHGSPQCRRRLRAKEGDRVGDTERALHQKSLSHTPSDQSAIVRVKGLDRRDEVRLAQVRGRLPARRVEELRAVGLDGSATARGHVGDIDDEARPHVGRELEIEDGRGAESLLAGCDLREAGMVSRLRDEAA